ncbi:MAG: SCO family protein [Firmicutes bacterium]|nr:SCO family protein [Bacillota bacterium]
MIRKCISRAQGLRRSSARWVVIVLAGWAMVTPATAQIGGTTAQELSPAHKYFTDVILVNQFGEPLRLYSDLLRGKIVVINSFFATCTSVCPVMNRKMAQIQEALGDRVGRDVFLLSITVDPENDTPARLREYAASYSARPGWHFLTGKRENVELALRKLGQYVAAREDHLTLMIVGNEPTGLWKKVLALADIGQILETVLSVANDKGPTAPAGKD